MHGVDQYQHAGRGGDRSGRQDEGAGHPLDREPHARRGQEHGEGHRTGDHTAGGAQQLDRPKSSPTHHFKALREAGVTRQRQYGLERRSHVRTDDLDARFPGLLALVAAWTPRQP